MDMTFKGTKPDFVTLMEKRRPIKTPVAWGTLAVPGRPGVVLTEKIIDPITIPVKILIEGRNRDEYLRNVEKVAEWLDSSKEEALIFSDDPNREYKAVAQGEVLPTDEIVIFSIIDIDFFCPNPYKYAPPETVPFTDGTAVLYNQGSIPVGPIIKANVLQNVSYMDVFTEDRYMRIGKPPNDGQALVDPEPLVFHDPFSNLTGWEYGGLAVDGGEAIGSFTTQDGYFIPNDYGTGGTYHGPAAKKAVPQAPLTDFKVEYEVKFMNVKGKYGRTELYLLDDLGNHIGKLAIKSRYHNPNNTVEVRIGGGTNYRFLVNYEGGPKGTEWNSFEGVIRLQRKGNVFEAYVAKVNQTTGKHYYAHHVRYEDVENQFPGNLSQVQVHTATWGQQEPLGAQAKDVKVWTFTEVPELDPSIIAVPGDEIEINFPDSAIYINGEDRKKLKDIAATFFKLPPGTHALLLHPLGAFDATATIREGFK